jgi:hypothetical protein
MTAAPKYPLLESHYAHRENPDGTYDSICLACFQTVANAPREDLLVEDEQFHDLNCWRKKAPTSDRSISGLCQF